MPNYGEEFSTSIGEYLKTNCLRSLGQINSKVLAEQAQRFQEYWIKKQKVKKQAISDDEWFRELQIDPANQGLSVMTEVNKCKFWCKRNEKNFTRMRFTRWLLRADRSLEPKANGHRPGISQNISDLPNYDWRAIGQRLFPNEVYEGLEPWDTANWQLLGVAVRQGIIKEAAKTL